MSKNKHEIYLPTICARGVVVFPNQKVIIEVGRQISINAIEEAQKNFDGHIWLTCQKDMLVEDPKVEDLYAIGTVCHIVQCNA